MHIPLSAAIFDCDGTLLDSEQYWLQLIDELCQELSLDRAMMGDVHGATATETAARLAQLSGSTLGDAKALIDQRYSELLEKIDRPLPGVRKLLQHMAGHIPLAVATNGQLADVDTMLSRTGLIDYFDEIVTIDDVNYGKPHPEIYVHACRRLGVLPEETVVFEDSAIGAEAAHNAGCQVIGLGLSTAVQYHTANMTNVSFDPKTKSLLLQKGSEHVLF